MVLRRQIPAVLVLLPLAVLQLSAQTPTGVRRPGGGAGMDYNAYDPATLERGKTTFVSQCGGCHGSNAKGGEGGPDLIRAVPVIDDENGNLIGPIVRGARQAQGMPKFDLSQTQILEIAAFLHDGVRAAAERGTYKILNIVTGNARAGEAFFNGEGKCNTCHSPTGDLKGIGAKYDPINLQSRFLMPAGGRGNTKRTTSPIVVTVTTAPGKSVKGTLERIDDFNVSLTDAEGNYHSFVRKGEIPRVGLKDPLQAHYDMLPKYTDAEIHNLTAWLVTLK
ncbi:MAG TPA: c-type cytochrome [Bryobacteraceae bacterium]|nr:c-type cytochrome [Bryobacteraceae bacterium]